MGRLLLGGILLSVAFCATVPAQDKAAQSDSGKSVALFVLTRQGKIPDAGVEEVKYEVSKAPSYELLVIEIAAAKLEDKNSYLGRYYEHAVKREGKKGDFALYAKVQLKAQTKLSNFKQIGERAVMKFFSGAIGTVNPNPADKKKRPDSDSFHIYQVEAVEPR
jgi:hypothetical protein